MVLHEWPALSARERQLLKLASHGFTDTAIANQLGIRETTVGTYWKRIRAKIGPYSRTELVAIVLKSQLDRTLSNMQEQAAKETAANGIYRQLLENAPDAIFILSPNGVIELMNETAASIFGWTIAELSGQHVSILVPERFRTLHNNYVSEYVASPSKRPMRNHVETPGLHRSGSEIAIDASLSTIGVGDDLRIICIVRSMSERDFGA